MRENIAVSRRKAELTQKQVAERVGITEISYQRIERGRQNPSLRTAFRIADVLQTSVDQLWGDSLIK